MCMEGFDGDKAPPGKVRGYRAWTYAGGELLGMRGEAWRGGENTAFCFGAGGHPVPSAEHGCGCGFWIRREFNRDDYGMDEKPVAGVVEGSGRKLAGPLGWRCRKAKIVALYLAYEYVLPGNPMAGWSADKRGTPEAVVRLDEDRAALAARYPSAVIYDSLDRMLADYPAQGGNPGTA